jgi:hypothetical protein
VGTRPPTGTGKKQGTPTRTPTQLNRRAVSVHSVVTQALIPLSLNSYIPNIGGIVLSLINVRIYNFFLTQIQFFINFEKQAQIIVCKKSFSASEIVTILLNDDFDTSVKDKSLEIFDANSNSKYKLKEFSKENTIETASWKDGFYYVKLRYNGNDFTYTVRITH